MIADQRILDAIDAVATGLVVSQPLDRRAVLAALTAVETSWGERSAAGLFEASYYRGGAYYKAANVREAVQRYESLASCSYGPWQLLYVSAWECGYRGHPTGLLDPATSAPWVVELLNRRVRDKGALLAFPDAWNTGRDGDGILPKQTYLDRYAEAYTEALEYYARRDAGATT